MELSTLRVRRHNWGKRRVHSIAARQGWQGFELEVRAGVSVLRRLNTKSKNDALQNPLGLRKVLA